MVHSPMLTQAGRSRDRDSMELPSSMTQPPQRGTNSSALRALRARQVQTLDKICRFQREARHEADLSALRARVDDIVARLREDFAEEERYLRAISHPGQAEHFREHQRLRVDLAKDWSAIVDAGHLPSAQVAHLFDSYLIHQATTSDFGGAGLRRGLGRLARSAMTAAVAAEPAQGSACVRRFESAGVAQ